MSRIQVLAAAFTMIAGAIAFSSPVLAQAVIINQAKALAGNVTPGDAPGFPVTLSLPGSYRLNSNLSVGANLDGIVIGVPDITIDFNDFILAGGRLGGTNNAHNGIDDQSDRLTVKNGTIIAFEQDGISAQERAHLTVENMRIINNGSGVFNYFGNMTRIQNSTISRNAATGVFCGISCHVEGNIVSSNGATGITIRNGTILGNTIFFNGGRGIQVENFPNVETTVGFGNNSLADNFNGGIQVYAPGNAHLRPLFPNACTPAC